MKVTQLEIANFRNLERVSLKPSPHLNFFVGMNAQGKTSVLEALDYLASLRSFRNSKAKEIVRWETLGSQVLAQVLSEDAQWDGLLRVDLTSEGKRTAYINEKPYKSGAAYLKQKLNRSNVGFHTIVFNPADHELVRGAPSLRREFLSHALGAEDPEYQSLLRTYQRVLTQRNAALRMEQPRPVVQTLTEEFLRLGSMLFFKHWEGLKRLDVEVRQIQETIAPNQPSLSLAMVTSIGPHFQQKLSHDKELDRILFARQGCIPSLEEIDKAYRQRWQELEPMEWRSGTSLWGPHRDDWALFYGPSRLKGNGSQGETRTALLALKLAESEIFRRKTGLKPIFLLDDFSSELDEHRRKALMTYLSEMDLQVFVTTTALGDRKDWPQWQLRDSRVYDVRSGSLQLVPSQDS